MSEQTQHQWAEQAVQAVNHIFPAVAYETWEQCQRYLPHAQVCVSLIFHYNLAFPEAARLLNHVGWYLQEHAQYVQAELLLKRALVMREHVLGSDHPDIASTLDNLARTYCAQGQYAQAEPLVNRALTIKEKALGFEHPKTAATLDTLAQLYRDQGWYKQAEPLLKRSLTT